MCPTDDAPPPPVLPILVLVVGVLGVVFRASGIVDRIPRDRIGQRRTCGMLDVPRGREVVRSQGSGDTGVEGRRAVADRRPIGGECRIDLRCGGGCPYEGGGERRRISIGVGPRRVAPHPVDVRGGQGRGRGRERGREGGDGQGAPAPCPVRLRTAARLLLLLLLLLLRPQRRR